MNFASHSNEIFSKKKPKPRLHIHTPRPAPKITDNKFVRNSEYNTSRENNEFFPTRAKRIE